VLVVGNIGVVFFAIGVEVTSRSDGTARNVWWRVVESGKITSNRLVMPDQCWVRLAVLGEMLRQYIWGAE